MHDFRSYFTETVQARDDPIPIYAEMSSVNPIFIFPEALEENFQQIAQGLSDSVTLGVGQFCTNPGIVFIAGDVKSSNNFICALSEAISKVSAAIGVNNINRCRRK